MISAKMSVTLLFGVLSALSQTTSADEYVVTIKADNPRLALVSAALEPEGAEIGMNEEGVHGLENGWATFVQNIEVAGADGTTYAVEAQADSRWSLPDYVAGPINLTYEVVLGHDEVEIKFGDNGAAYAMPTGVMWAGRALFIAGKPARDISIRFDLPDDWNVTTAWKEKAEPDRAFNVQNTEDLLNSAFFAGTHEQVDLIAGEVTLRLALSGENTLAMRDQITDMTGLYLDYYESAFRSPTKASMVLIASDRSYWGGELMGRAISLSIGGKPPPGYNPLSALSHVIAHEIFHVFSLIRMEISEDPGTFQWFAEGFGAEYAAWLARLRLGQFDAEEFLAELVTQRDKYQAQLDGTLTLESAGKTKAEHYDMVYSGGFIAAMSLDFLIRSQSNGEKSLDDLWTYLLNHYPRGGEELTIPGLLEAALGLYGSGIAGELEAYITSPDPIPFMENAALMGLRFGDGILTVSGNASASQKALWESFVTR